MKQEETGVLDDWSNKVPKGPTFRRLKRNQEENQEMIDFLDEKIEKNSESE